MLCPCIYQGLELQLLKYQQKKIPVFQKYKHSKGAEVYSDKNKIHKLSMILKWAPVFICRLLKVLISTLYPIFILWVWGQEVLVLIMISNNKLPNSSNIMQMHSNMHGSQITKSDVWHPPNGQWTKGRKTT